MYKISDKLHRECNGKLKGVIDWKSNYYRGKTPKRYLPVRPTLATAFRYSNDTIQLRP